MDVINKLLKVYNKSMHSTIGKSPSKISPFYIYSVWRRVNTLGAKIPQGRVKFKVGDLARLTKEKVKFAKRYEQMFPTEIFRVV